MVAEARNDRIFALALTSYAKDLLGSRPLSLLLYAGLRGEAAHRSVWTAADPTLIGFKISEGEVCPLSAKEYADLIAQMDHGEMESALRLGRYLKEFRPERFDPSYRRGGS